MTRDRGDLLRGALEMLVLRILQDGPTHGYAITESIRESSGGILEIEEGSMYPALYRMQERGWITASWGRSENNRRAKFYRLTDQGRHHLETASERWTEFSEAVGKVMEPAS